jgi:hypothetical protein
MTPSPDPEEVRLDPALAALTAGAKVGSGRFTLLRLLGHGGMGVVWLARDEHLREELALKFLPPEIRHDAVALDDLRRETSRSRKLTHPNIIRIHDIYKAEDEAFISMEYVDGPNLSELRLQQPDRVFKWSFLEPLMKQLCDALDYAHREHVIHRDLKPANLMLDSRERLKLADFGLSATVSDSLSRASMGNHALSGTASYMSPQQLDGQLPQVTDDIYSLGSALYELLTSRAPFFTGDIAHQVRSLPPQPVEKRLAQLRIANPMPPAVAATIAACLAKQPEKRPPSARAVAEQMGLWLVTPGQRTLLAGVDSTAEPAQAAARPAATIKDEPENTAKAESVRPFQPERIRGSRRALAGVAAVIAILAIGATGLWWSSRQHASNKATHVTQTDAPKPAAPEFVPLFNGRDLSDWDGNPKVWTVQDGAMLAIAGTSKERHPEAIFWRGGPVDNFELHLSFRIETGNSGVYYRAKRLSGHEVGGYQFEIAGDKTGNLLETGADRPRREPARRGSVTIAKIVDGGEKLTIERPLGSFASLRSNDWNEVVIIVRGNHVVHKLNGRTTIETTDETEERPRSGLVAFEVYGRDPTTVRFRDIRLKRLPPHSGDAAAGK